MPTTRSSLLLLLACGSALTGWPATAQTLLTTIPTGSHPLAIARNATTRKLYVANQNSNNVTVIDEVTYATAMVAAGASPADVAVNPVTNKIYVANQNGSTVTVIDGATNSTTAVATGISPIKLAINSATNWIYVANYFGHSVTAINGSNNSTITIPAGRYPTAIAVNPSTNKVYVANLGDDTVTVIDGLTGNTTTVAAGSYPNAVAVDSLTDKIYVTDGTFYGGTGTVTVIDGATNSTTVVPVGLDPDALAVNAASNQIYVVNASDGTITDIDGASNSTQTIAVVTSPGLVGVDPILNKIYVTADLAYGNLTTIDGATGSTTTIAILGNPYAVVVDPQNDLVYTANLTGNTVAVIGVYVPPPPPPPPPPPGTGWQFVPAAPCRIADTRNPIGEFGGPVISGGTVRDFTVPDNLSCGIPANAAAYSLNVTAVPHGALGFLTVWPAGEDQPLVSTLNSADGRIKANAAIVPAGVNGAIRIYASNTTDLVLDIDGYFVAAPNPSAYAFFPLTPCRVADTRWTNSLLGGPYLYGNRQRNFPVLAASCGIRDSAVAYSLNFAALPRFGAMLGYLTVWPAGQSQPLVSTLNALTGTTTANAAIVPAGQGGQISVYVTHDTDLVIDINGYFAPPALGGLSLYATTPCRVLDTRTSSGRFAGELTVNGAGGNCGVPASAQAYVFSATVVRYGGLGFLTLWPDGLPRPLASTLNAFGGATTSNMAIVPTSNGYIDAYASSLTDLILDISSYFAP